MALLRMKYGAKPRNLKHFYDRCFFSCLFLGEQSRECGAFSALSGAVYQPSLTGMNSIGVRAGSLPKTITS